MESKRIDELLTEIAEELPTFVPPEVAERVSGWSRKTQANMRSLGEAPPHLHIGRKVFYPKAEFLQWLRNRIRG